HLGLRVEFAHQLQQRRDFTFGKKLEKRVHGRVLGNGEMLTLPGGLVRFGPAARLERAGCSCAPVIMASQLVIQSLPRSCLMLDRRTFLAVCSRLGLTTTLLPGVLWGLAEEKKRITREM